MDENVDPDIADLSLNIENANIFNNDGSSDSESGHVSDNGASSEDSDEEDTVRRGRAVTTKLSPHLKGLMGEANVRYARGEVETAKKMCFEVIRQAPEAYEPFETLSLIYENTNQKKHKLYLMLAGCLAPSNAGLLSRLSEVYAQENSINEAINCLTKAIRAEPKNMEFYKRKIELLETKGESTKRRVLNCKQRMAMKMNKKHFDEIIKICMDVAKQYYEDKNYARAIDALYIPFKRFSDKVPQDMLNMMLEVLLASNRLSEVLDYFTQYCGFTFDLTVEDDNSIVVNSYEIPEKLQVDLKMKFVQCMVRLKATDHISGLINSILQEDDVEEVGDLYIDVVEALMSCNYSTEALKLLVPLVKSKTYSLAAVYLKYAECLNNCEMYEQAIDAYFTVMQLAPQHVEVLYPLAMLLLRCNRKKEALEVLSQDFSNNKIDVLVLIEQMKLLKEIADFESYWKCAELLLSRHCITFKYLEELQIVVHSYTIREKINKIKDVRNFRNDYSEVETNLISTREPSVEEEYELYKEILQLARDQKEFAILQKFAFMGLSSKRFMPYFKELILIAFYACIQNRDIYHAYALVKEILHIKLKSNQAWNWFVLVMQIQDSDFRPYRFLERHNKDHRAPAFMEAHFNYSTNSSAQGVKFFAKEYQKNKTAYSAFMIGLILLHMHNSKLLDKSKKKGLAETITYVFMEYARLRCQKAKHEVWYNIGRMYHQLGVSYMAENYYKMVLKYDNTSFKNREHILDLKREAAFNLHIIYKHYGNHKAARNVIMKYIVIE